MKILPEMSIPGGQRERHVLQIPVRYFNLESAPRLLASDHFRPNLQRVRTRRHVLNREVPLRINRTCIERKERATKRGSIGGLYRHHCKAADLTRTDDAARNRVRLFRRQPDIDTGHFIPGADADRRCEGRIGHSGIERRHLFDWRPAGRTR